MPSSLKLSAADLCLHAPLEFTTPQQRQQWVRDYLQKLKSEGLNDLAFRDLRGDMASWRRQFHAALAPAMHRARGLLLEELARESSPAPENDEHKRERELQRIIRTGRSVAAALRSPGFHVPPLAMTMLAEALKELRAKLVECQRKSEVVEKICQDAVRNILVQNGFMSSLLSGISGTAALVAFKVITYVKAVFGMDGTSKDGTHAAIMRAVENDDRDAATRFLANLCEALSEALPAVEIHWPHEDMDGDSAAAKEHAKMKHKLFIDTWATEGTSSMDFRALGSAHFLQPDGQLEKWNSPVSLSKWLGTKPSDTLPAAILHVAGPQLLRYIREYLLGGERGKALGLRPGAAFNFELASLLRRDADEFVLDIRAVDDNFNRKGLASGTKAEESDSFIESEDEADANARKVHLEVRLQIRFRRPDLFQMHSALIVKAEY